MAQARAAVPPSHFPERFDGPGSREERACLAQATGHPRCGGCGAEVIADGCPCGRMRLESGLVSRLNANDEEAGKELLSMLLEKTGDAGRFDVHPVH